MPEDLFLESLVIILACAGTVALFARLGFPTVLGYLAAGLAIGPHGLAILRPSDGVRFLAELGVVFLLFMVGLEFSLSRMIANRRIVFGVGGLHVIVTTLVLAGGAILLEFDGHSAIVLGGVVAISSTAVVLKQLSDQGELSTSHGRIVVGILLFEDLAALVFLVLVDAWSRGQQTDVLGIARDLGVASLAFAAVAFVSRPLFRGMLASVARLRSNDSMLLCTLALALGTAFLTHRFGLSPPIGAFLAGMMIGETDLRHQIGDDIRPFRDLLLGLFFVAIGMGIDLSVMLRQPGAIVIWLTLFAAKSIVVTAVTKLIGWPLPVAARAGACLAQGSEFGLLLLSLAMGAGILTGTVGQPALMAVAISMGVAPVIVQHNERVGLLVGGRRASRTHYDDAAVREESEQLSRHVILLGCGRVGRLVAAVLKRAQIPYIAFEKNFDNFQEAKRRGCNVVCADGARSQLLKAAGLERARLLVITFDTRHIVERILMYARHENQELPTLVSTGDDREAGVIAEAGASVVYPENLAAGLELGDQALIILGLSQDEAAAVITALRTELNPDLRGHVGC